MIFLRTYPVRFSRQKVLGRYIADFYCAEAKLIIELDGSGHYTEEGKQYDEERTAFLEEYSLTVIEYLIRKYIRIFGVFASILIIS